MIFYVVYNQVVLSVINKLIQRKQVFMICIAVSVESTYYKISAISFVSDDCQPVIL